MSVRVGILNVGGYAGAELARLLSGHPEAELVAATARSGAGQRLSALLPYYRGRARDLIVTAEIETDVDVVFSALPHAASAERLLPFIKAGVRCLDLSADFRLTDAATYQAWYKTAHPAPDLLAKAVYGLTELNRERVKSAAIVACPGCFPTGALLALAPLLKRGLIGDWVIVDAKTGVSGAGRSAKAELGFSELDGGVGAYGVGGHRHAPEMAQEAARLSQAPLNLRFVPHLVPMARGILSSCYARLTRDVGDIAALYREFYAGEPFITIVDAPPKTKYATGGNHVFIHPTVDGDGGVVVFSALDNLVKGAAGQAVQNFNLMLNFAETSGLEGVAVYP